MPLWKLSGPGISAILPSKLARFSMNALGPSLASSVEKIIIDIRRSIEWAASRASPLGTEGQVNEVLCKVLCHNICILIQSTHELGIESNYV